MCQLNCIQQSDKCNYNFSFESNQIFHIKRNFSAKNAHSVCDLEDESALLCALNARDTSKVWH